MMGCLQSMKVVPALHTHHVHYAMAHWKPPWVVFFGLLHTWVLLKLLKA